MKLLNHTLGYLAVSLLVVLSIWAGLFYFAMLDEIYDSIDDGLENTSLLVIARAAEDSTVLHRSEFGEGNYALREIPEAAARSYKEAYLDTQLFMENEKDYEPVRVLRTAFRGQNGRYYELSVISSMVEEDDLIEDLLYALLWLYVVILVSMLIVNNILLRKIWKPFYGILDRLRSFRLGEEVSPDEEKTKVKEFNMLRQAVTDLLQRDTEIYRSQKQFIENASHELQTPLAISINQLELLAEQGLDESQMEQLGNVIRTLERLTRLNKSLLLLSRIENRQFAEESKVSVNELCRDLERDFADLAELRNVTLLLEEASTLDVVMNKDLAVVLISNLLRNAIRYNRPGGEVKITIGEGEVRVENTAVNGKLDEAHIYDRFFREQGESGSTGLGLAIVKSVATLYRLKLQYTYTGGHHRFSVMFGSRTVSLSQ